MNHRTFVTTLLAAPAALWTLTREVKASSVPVPTDVYYQNLPPLTPPKSVAVCCQEFYVGSQQAGMSEPDWQETWRIKLVRRGLSRGFIHVDEFRVPWDCRLKYTETDYDGFTSMRYSHGHYCAPLHPPVPITNLTISLLPWSAEGRAKLAPHFQDYHAIARWTQSPSQP